MSAEFSSILSFPSPRHGQLLLSYTCTCTCKSLFFRLETWGCSVRMLLAGSERRKRSWRTHSHPYIKRWFILGWGGPGALCGHWCNRWFSLFRMSCWVNLKERLPVSSRSCRRHGETRELEGVGHLYSDDEEKRGDSSVQRTSCFQVV